MAAAGPCRPQPAPWHSASADVRRSAPPRRWPAQTSEEETAGPTANARGRHVVAAAVTAAAAVAAAARRTWPACGDAELMRRGARCRRAARKCLDVWEAQDSSTSPLQKTFNSVILPTIAASVSGALFYVPIVLALQAALDIGDTGQGPVLNVLGLDQSQFLQNFLTVDGLLFSILCGNTYSSLYSQQERLFHALYLEVTEARSLLEQVCLLCQGRPFYRQVLQCIGDYVQHDLRRIDRDPAELLSGKPMDDPLEWILYTTSVGVPSTIYDTLRDLRQARGNRLGATQRKLPEIHFTLLYTLGIVELAAFPLLGAGTASLFRERNVLAIQAVLFGALCGAIVMTLQVTQELWKPVGGAYTVETVLETMVHGLQQELAARYNAVDPRPMPYASNDTGPGLGMPMPLRAASWQPDFQDAAAEEGWR